MSPDITVLVAQIIPCDMPLPKCTDGVAAFNAAVASFASLSTGESSVVVVDFATGFDPDYYRDAVHVTDAGDEFFAGRWMAALEDSGVIATSG